MSSYGQLNDASGTIATGGTAQPPSASVPAAVNVVNLARRYLLLVNQSTAVIFVDFGQTASAASIPLKACSVAGDGSGGSLEFKTDGGGFMPTGIVSVFCATTGAAYTLKVG